MLRPYAWATLLLLGAVCGALSSGPIEEHHSPPPTMATPQSAPIEEETREDLTATGNNVNVDDARAIGAKFEESVANPNKTNVTVGMGQNESVIVESESASQPELEPASHGDESQASKNEASQASDGEAGHASEGNEDPTSVKEILEMPEGGNPATQKKEGSASPEEGESEGPSIEEAGGTGQPAAVDTQEENHGFSLDEDERTGKILAYYTTKTKNLFATTTVSRLSTCFSATNTNQCQGRRKKRNLDRNIDASIFSLDSSEDLHSTAGNPVEPNFGSASQVKGDRDPRKFTVWSTLFSTFTLTSTYYYPGTTVTVSGLCVLPGFGSGCFG